MYRNPHKEGGKKKEGEHGDMQRNPTVLIHINKLSSKSLRTGRSFNIMAFVSVCVPLSHASTCLTYLNLVL